MSSKTMKKPQFSHYRRRDYEILNANPPVDLSFKQANTVEDLEKKPVHGFRIGKKPAKTSSNHFLTSSLWLGNNHLYCTDKLEDLVEKKLKSPKDLRWLDLSANQLTSISDDILNFKSLTILYLHGNKISDINEIVKLRKLLNLRSLTLHGNPIEDMSAYRRYVIAILPQISNLDFSPIIDYERKKALPTGFFKTIHLCS